MFTTIASLKTAISKLYVPLFPLLPLVAEASATIWPAGALANEERLMMSNPKSIATWLTKTVRELCLI